MTEIDTSAPDYRAMWQQAIENYQAMMAERDALAERVARFDKLLTGPRAGAHLSHIEVAAKVRMLMRDDLDHEMVCVIARDRIVALADAVGSAEAARDAARAECVSLASQLQEAQAEAKRLREHIANLHNRVRHEFSAEIEAAADKAFKAMSGIAALAGAPRDE